MSYGLTRISRKCLKEIDELDRKRNLKAYDMKKLANKKNSSYCNMKDKIGNTLTI